MKRLALRLGAAILEVFGGIVIAVVIAALWFTSPNLQVYEVENATAEPIPGVAIRFPGAASLEIGTVPAGATIKGFVWHNPDKSGPIELSAIQADRRVVLGECGYVARSPAKHHLRIVGAKLWGGDCSLTMRLVGWFW